MFQIVIKVFSDEARFFFYLGGSQLTFQTKFTVFALILQLKLEVFYT